MMRRIKLGIGATRMAGAALHGPILLAIPPLEDDGRRPLTIIFRRNWQGARDRGISATVNDGERRSFRPPKPEAGTPMEIAEDPVPQEGALTAALGRRSVVLIGLMGAGKSSIGRRLAQRLGLSFVDADTEIEAAHAGVTIAEIFEIGRTNV